ncbi:phage tail assembly protein [Sphingomonas sp. CBMAI 2297]|uniref:phage tail assembly protein n=1 Tax=Sphingomonas sp. CBMAI 2297 TaxID=2991720 RepID=UPI002454B8DD|nr:phage tail assembly protein [Sphingomonas sp. CBMAI 2297]MDH4745822.1 phage tail assembly protein [Sphingomonas sp. CBMAI 2297]
MSAKPEEPGLDEDLVITFRKAIDGVAGPIASIVIREPTAGEMMQWDRLSGVEADVKAISVVAGIPPVDVEKLAARDFIRASRRIAAFLD